MEGGIKRSEKGFTLVEMVVVMGIMALLMLIAATGLMAARDQYYADQTAEEIITFVRDAQSRAISFTPGSGTGSTKVWGVSFNDQQIRLLSVADDNGTITHVDNEESAQINPNIQITPIGGDRVYFASPFATTHLCNGKATNWQESTTKPSKEYVPLDCSTATSVTINLEFRGNTQTVTIESNGDVYAN